MEVVRLRLDELLRSGCGVSLDARQLSEQVQLLSADPGVRDQFAVTPQLGHFLLSYYAGDSSGLALYAWKNSKVVTRVVVTQDGPKQEQRLLPLAVEVFQPPGASDPLLAISNTHPWMASCWRSLRFRVLEPSGNPLAPRILLDRKASGRWCEDHGITARGATVEFSYPDWYSVFKPMMVRGRVLSFDYQAGKLVERFGFAKEFPELIEDWLSQDWSLAQQASLPAAQKALAATHKQLSGAARRALAARGGVDFSTEVMPGGSGDRRRVVVYCALSADDTKPCAAWPKPVDFQLERHGGHWLVAAAKSR